MDENFFPYLVSKIYGVILILIAIIFGFYYTLKIPISLTLTIPLLVMGIVYIKKSFNKTTNKYSDWNIIVTIVLLLIFLLFFLNRNSELSIFAVILMLSLYGFIGIIFVLIYEGLIKR